jgi:hypothetical protein
VWADLLNKFHTSSGPIRALWLLVAPLMVVGVTWLVMRGMRDIAVAIHPQPEIPKSLLVYGVVQDPDGQWHVIRHGHAPKPLDWTNPPPELLRRPGELN